MTKCQLIEEAYKTILVTSQKFYKPDLKEGYYTQKVEGIQMLLAGCSSVQLFDIICMELVPALGPDDQLIQN